MRCAEARELLAEVALGVVPGRERGEVLRHVDGCPACRSELERLAGVADALLALAPPAEPPSGFEERTLEGLRPPRRAARLVAGVAAVALVAAAAGVAATYAAGHHSRYLAHEYAETLRSLHGRSLRSALVRDERGRPVGEAVLYDGRPSWLFVALERSRGEGGVEVRLIGGGKILVVPGLVLRKGRGALGSVVRGDVGLVHRLEVVDGRGHTVAGATFGESRG